MCIQTAVQMQWYHVPKWKCIGISLAIIVTGLIASRLWFFLENGFWDGRSFYGAVYFAPITFLFVAKLLKIPYLYTLDFCATAGCLVLGVLKIQCMLAGCCEGILLYINEDRIYVRFPSQKVEFICALALTAVLLVLSRKQKYRGRIYPITLVLYGISRFVLNLFRNDWRRAESMNLILPLGNIWSLIAVIIGIIWLVSSKHYKSTMMTCKQKDLHE